MLKNKKLVTFGLLFLAISPVLWILVSAHLVRAHHGGHGSGNGIVVDSKKEPQVAQYLQDRFSKWQNQDFVPLSNEEDVHIAANNLSYHFDTALSPAELQALTNAVVDFISAYQDGTFESFTKFRMPVRAFHFAEGVSNAMHERFSISVKTIRDDPVLAWKEYWQATIKDSYSHYWIGLSVANSEVRVEESTCPTNDLGYFLTEGSPTFTVDSIGNLKLFAQELKDASENQKVYIYVKSHLSRSASEILFGGHAGLDEARGAVVQDLNRLIQSGHIYDPNLFENVRLAPETENLLKLNPSGAELVRLNRLLLVDAFPHALKRSAWLENAGLSFHRPAIYIEPSREQILKTTGNSIKVATIRVLPKPRGEDPAYPVYLRCYWSPQDQKWLPEQLMVMFAGRRGRDLFF